MNYKQQQAIKSPPQVCFLYKQGRGVRLDNYPDSPSEFLYGFPQLRSHGFDVSFFEDFEIGLSAPTSFFRKSVTKLSFFFGELPIGMIVPLFLRKNRHILNQQSVIIATTNALGLTMGLALIARLIKPRVIILAMGVVPRDASFWARTCLSIALSPLQIVTISKSEQKFLQKYLPNKRIHYLPFGVDQRFWARRTSEPSPENSYILAIGNDRYRDWETLVKAWDDSLPLLKLVTSKPIPSVPSNIEVIRGDWRTALLSDEEIKQLYENALIVVIPLFETIQPAGQSVCLQAMATGSPVIMTQTQGIWDDELMVDDVTLKLVPSRNPRALRQAVIELTNNGNLRQNISNAAYNVVCDHFNTEIMAENIAKIINMDPKK